MAYRTPKSFANDSVSYPDNKQKLLSSAAAPSPSILSMPLQASEDGSGAKNRGLSKPLPGGKGLTSLIQGPAGGAQMSPQILALMQMLKQWMGKK
jgi:hypothetical protein